MRDLFSVTQQVFYLLSECKPSRFQSLEPNLHSKHLVSQQKYKLADKEADTHIPTKLRNHRTKTNLVSPFCWQTLTRIHSYKDLKPKPASQRASEESGLYLDNFYPSRSCSALMFLQAY